MEDALATKTISLDLDAYDRLSAARREGESFSEAVKRLVPPAVDLEAWFRELDENPLSREAVDAVEEVVRSRSRRPRSAR